MMIKMVLVFLLVMVLLAMIAAQVMKFFRGGAEARFCQSCGGALKKGRCTRCKI